jgi:unsaturated chondroitin disaccharide hydrolase
MSTWSEQPAIDKALATIRRATPRFADTPPVLGRADLTYETVEPGTWSWVAGFWTGELWLAHAETGDSEFLEAARSNYPYFRSLFEIPERHSHDLGFLFSLSAVADYKLTGNLDARDLAVAAATSLAERYNRAGGFIRAWNPWPEHDNRGRMIIDGMENLALLFWAAGETGDAHYHEIAEAHARTAARHLVRSDGSSFHTFEFDPDNGNPLRGGTHQGYSDESCWSRGQAWGIHGFSLAYRYTGDALFLDTARRLADYAIAHLPDDLVPYWDYLLPEGSPCYRDTSAAAITAAGLLLLSEQIGGGLPAERYADVAKKILAALDGTYSTFGVPGAEGLLTGGAAHVAQGCTNVMLPYGDYFYLEALLRAKGTTEFSW